MQSSHVFLLSLGFLRVVCDCNTRPISFPIRNFTISQGAFEQRGVYANLGGQASSLRLSTLFNNTSIRNSQDCSQGNSTENAVCVANSGGVVDISKSTGWAYAPPNQWNVSRVDPPATGQKVIQGWDTVQFENGTATPGFPLQVSTKSGDSNYSELSIGPSSSFLDWLMASKLAPSKVVGLYYGSRSQSEGVDGELIVGGFDRSRVAGPWSNYTMSDQFLGPSVCPLQVLIRDITLNNANGSFPLLGDSRSMIPACVDPLQNLFIFTPAMFNRYMALTNWANTTGGVPAPTYPASADGLLGDLTISLSNGFTINIPKRELVSQVRGPDAKGTFAVVDAERRQLAVSTNGAARPPTMGGVFFSQVYMLIDYENRILSLAPAVVGKQTKSPRDIETICNTSPSPSPDSNHGPSGNIVGPAVGAALGGSALAAAAVVAAFLIRKRSRRANSRVARGPETPAERPERTVDPPTPGLPRSPRIRGALRGNDPQENGMTPITPAAVPPPFNRWPSGD